MNSYRVSVCGRYRMNLEPFEPSVERFGINAETGNKSWLPVSIEEVDAMILLLLMVGANGESE